MIIRIATEGQYELDAADEEQLNELDNKAVGACAMDDAQEFRQAYDELLEFVRGKGRPVGDDHLGGSDLILPPPDVTLEEARAEFSAEGLIPD